MAATALELVLPNLDGAYEVGIATNLDPKLREDIRLPIYVPAGVNFADAAAQNNAAKLAAFWAYNTFATMSDQARKLLVNGAVVAIRAGWTACNLPAGHEVPPAGPARYADPDCDIAVSQEATAGTQSWQQIPNQYITTTDMMDAATIAIATKVSWWVTNHHTGQSRDKAVGYIGKVLRIKYPNGVTANIIEAAHTLRHWCSTKRVLTQADIRGILLQGNLS